jgi:hypothetical protein
VVEVLVVTVQVSNQEMVILLQQLLLKVMTVELVEINLALVITFQAVVVELQQQVEILLHLILQDLVELEHQIQLQVQMLLMLVVVEVVIMVQVWYKVLVEQVAVEMVEFFLLL